MVIYDVMSAGFNTPGPNYRPTSALSKGPQKSFGSSRQDAVKKAGPGGSYVLYKCWIKH